MSNSRVIHGIISVPNRVEMKRNQINNTEYQQQLKEYRNRVDETSINLNCMIQKPLETEQAKEGSEVEEKEETEEANCKENEPLQVESKKQEGVAS